MGLSRGQFTEPIKNDPTGNKREGAAERLYEQTLNRKREYEIKAVAKHTNFSEAEIDRIFAHVYEREHSFLNGTVHRFDPDYYMALSWQRLRNNDNIQPHDIIMLQHVLMEEKIMGDSLDIFYDDVHNEVEKKYNYREVLEEYLRSTGKG